MLNVGPAQGVVPVPGHVFSLGQEVAGHIRFNVAKSTGLRLCFVLERAGQGESVPP